MKFFAFTATVLLAFFLTSAQAQDGPDDQYVSIYGIIQQADALANGGQPRQALANYQTAQTALTQFHKINPDWSPNIVNYRLNYLADKIAATAALVPASRRRRPPRLPAARMPRWRRKWPTSRRRCRICRRAMARSPPGSGRP
jgi:hypothetical protein